MPELEAQVCSVCSVCAQDGARWGEGGGDVRCLCDCSPNLVKKGLSTSVIAAVL
jgi:hypothetical protein